MRIGDKVEIIDYSFATMIKDGKIIPSGGWPNIVREGHQIAIIIATKCVLPIKRPLQNAFKIKNDTIIHIPSDGRTLFINENYLKIKITPASINQHEQTKIKCIEALNAAKSLNHHDDWISFQEVKKLIKGIKI